MLREETVEGSKQIALCSCCAALSLSGSSLQPFPPRTVSGRKRKVAALIVVYSKLSFCIALGVGQGGSEGRRRKED